MFSKTSNSPITSKIYYTEMDIIKSLQEKIGPAEVDKIAVFLGESSDNIQNALELSFNTFLSGLINKSNDNEGIASVMNVIKDGGHSGDILDDLGGVFANGEKTKLLVTIGSNINNHFFGNDLSKISAKISEVGNIKKTSASSIFSLAAPLVLGYIGKKMRGERLDIGGLQNLISSQLPFVQSKLPPALFNIFSTKPAVANTNSAVVEEVVEKRATSKTFTNNSTKPKSEKNLGWLAWLLLGLLLLAALYYFKSCRLPKDETSTSLNATDSLGRPNQMEVFDKPEATILNQKETGEGASQKTVETDKATSNTLSNEQTTGLNQNSGAVSGFKSGETKNTKSNASTDFSNSSSKSFSSSASSRSSSSRGFSSGGEKLNASCDSETIQEKELNDSRVTLAPISKKTGWQGIGNLRFSSGNALINNKAALSQLITFMKQNPQATIELAGTSGGKSLAEDRAYAVLGVLFENGIESSRLSVNSSKSTGDGDIQIRIK